MGSENETSLHWVSIIAFALMAIVNAVLVFQYDWNVCDAVFSIGSFVMTLVSGLLLGWYCGIDEEDRPDFAREVITVTKQNWQALVRLMKGDY